MPIFDQKHADLVVALIGDKSDVQQYLGQLPQKIAIVTYRDSMACLDAFKARITDRRPPAELILLDAAQAGVDTAQFLTEFRQVRDFKKIPVIIVNAAGDTENPEHDEPSGGHGATFYLPTSGLTADYSGLSQIITDYWMTS